VVIGADEPRDIAEGAGGLAGEGVEFGEIGARDRGAGLEADFAEERDTGEVAAEVVVEIGGDAAPQGIGFAAAAQLQAVISSEERERGGDGEAGEGPRDDAGEHEAEGRKLGVEGGELGEAFAAVGETAQPGGPFAKAVFPAGAVGEKRGAPVGAGFQIVEIAHACAERDIGVAGVGLEFREGKMVLAVAAVLELGGGDAEVTSREAGGNRDSTEAGIGKGGGGVVGEETGLGEVGIVGGFDAETQRETVALVVETLGEAGGDEAHFVDRLGAAQIDLHPFDGVGAAGELRVPAVADGGGVGRAVAERGAQSGLAVDEVFTGPRRGALARIAGADGDTAAAGREIAVTAQHHEFAERTGVEALAQQPRLRSGKSDAAGATAGGREPHGEVAGIREIGVREIGDGQRLRSAAEGLDAETHGETITGAGEVGGGEVGRDEGDGVKVDEFAKVDFDPGFAAPRAGLIIVDTPAEARAVIEVRDGGQRGQFALEGATPVVELAKFSADPTRGGGGQLPGGRLDLGGSAAGGSGDREGDAEQESVARVVAAQGCGQRRSRAVGGGKHRERSGLANRTVRNAN
jgi:hypothetical protein